MKWVVHAYIFLWFLVPALLNAQLDKDFKKQFNKAESYFQYEEDYPLALPIYLELLKKDPENANLQFKIGACYLGIKGNNQKAINYLEQTVKNISRTYQYEDYKEQNAPEGAYFYLAQAYHKNYMVDKAIIFYKKYRGTVPSFDQTEIAFINQCIKSCENAKKITNTTQEFIFEPAENQFNSNIPIEKPVLSGDGKTFIYTRAINNENRIFYTRKEHNTWTKLQDITEELTTEYDCHVTSVSFDGTEMYIYKSDNWVGNLYVSYLKEGKWSKIEKLNKNINTKFWESHACITPDGTRLYFNSNREGGAGELDLYYSDRMKDGDWGPAKNMGRMINTPFMETTPALSPDGNILYFSSQGHNNYGGFDIFYSIKRKGNVWSKPENIGYPLNTTDDDLFYAPVSEISGLMVTETPKQPDKISLYKITRSSEDMLTRVNGKVIYTPGNETFPVTIDIMDGNGKNQIESITTNDKGSFTLKLQPGDYILSALHQENHEETSKKMNIPANKAGDSIQISILLPVLATIDPKPEPISPIVKNVPKKALTEKTDDPEGILIQNIYFGFNKFHLAKDAYNHLENLSRLLRANHTLILTVHAYSDAIGGEDFNLHLSRKRAYAIRDFLIKKGLTPSQITFVAHGEDHPLALNFLTSGRDNPEGRKWNRRAEFRFQHTENLNIRYEDPPIPPEYDIASVLNTQREETGNQELFTIQIKALEKPVNRSVFTNVKGLEVFMGKDGLYHYITGAYRNKEEAKKQLEKWKQAGYHDAFVKRVNDLF